MDTRRQIRSFRFASPLLLAGAVMAATPFPAVAAGPVVLTECQELATPGSYVVAQNLSPTSDTGDCFVVTANFITIDLAGFTLTGKDKGTGITDGGDGKHGITVKNGGIEKFAVGIDLDLSPASHISGVVVNDNKGGAAMLDCDDGNTMLRLGGIATGSGSIVTDVIARNNTGVGIKTGSGSRVTGNVAIDNTETGICVFSGSTVTGNTARRNGLDGLRTSSGSTVAGNTARQNTRDGFVVNVASNVSGNTAKDNTGNGFTVHCPSLVRSNLAIDNGRNLHLVTADGRCLVADNVSRTGRKKRRRDDD